MTVCGFWLDHWLVRLIWIMNFLGDVWVYRAVGLESPLLLFATGCKIQYAVALSLILTYQMKTKKREETRYIAKVCFKQEILFD